MSIKDMDFSNLEERVLAARIANGKWLYLGDGVYAQKDQWGIWLHANHHLIPTDKIYIEWSVLDALNQMKGEGGNYESLSS